MKETIIKILYALEKNGVAKESYTDSDVEQLVISINDSPFFEKEGKRLALNAVYLVNPDICRTFGLSDFVTGNGTEALYALKDISSVDLEIKDIDTNFEGDWETLEDEEVELEDDEVNVSAEINGNAMDFPYAIDDAEDVTKISNIIFGRITDEYPDQMNNILLTEAVEPVTDMYGIALICNIPSECLNEIHEAVKA